LDDLVAAVAFRPLGHLCELGEQLVDALLRILSRDIVLMP
jgi:hypothetical protein